MLQVAREEFELVLDQVRAAFPLEACGLMAGLDGQVYRTYPISNRLASQVAFEMDPLEQVEAMLDMESRGWNLLAIYHSHPHGPESPSPTDVAKAYYPEAAHVIISLRDREMPSARAFTIVDGSVSEIAFQVV